ncbi:YdgA family protein [Nitrogeniibacter aestuarii]|uniref:YdgA family protein n=1 Tax=Nitrogeniibacter aestuarii TaxID=2815343 RepID=UPI001D0F65FC|nr:YdgA family protein [Nitrogeniibacter aestuarii]
MKKTWLAVLALPVIAYPATSWYLGKQVQSNLDQQYAQLDANPFIKVVQRTYERGVFSANESVTIEVFGDMMRSMAGDMPEGMEAPEPLQLTFNSAISHGPFVAGLSAAVIDSELVIPETAQEEARKLFGDAKPLTAHTVVKFNGSGSSAVKSPALSAPLPAVDGGEPGHMAWEGLDVNIDFAADMSHYTMNGTAPKLEILDGKGVHMVMTGMTLAADQTRVFEDDPFLFAGTQSFTVGTVSISGPELEGEPVSLKDVSYDISAPLKDDFLDLGARISAQVVQVGDFNFGPAHYDFSLEHLHARTVSELYKRMMEMYSDPSVFMGKGDPAMAMSAMAGPAMALLQHDPVLKLDRLSFNTPSGEALVQARASLPGLQPEEAGNPMIMIGKLQASGSLALPEQMMREMMLNRTQSQLAMMDPEATLTDEQVAMVNAQLDAQLQQFESQGYIDRADGLIKARFAFKQGQLTVNDKPFNPGR